MHASDIREILKVTSRPEVISLAGGLPAPELFPVDRIRRAFESVLARDGQVALQYGPSEGYQPLRELVAARLTSLGVPAASTNVLVINGSQQGLDLVAKLFLDPGDAVLCENPTYLGAIQAFDSYEARYVIAPMDDDGMQTGVLDALLADRAVKFIYALPNFQNPSGRTLSAARRRALVETARRHGVPIVEDDAYGELRFEGEPLPSLRSLWPEGVIYLGTFSKILAPGFRLAWAVIPDALYDRFVLAKQPADLHTAMVTQMAAHEVASDSDAMAEHIDRLRDVYRSRRDTMLRALGEWFPPGCRWTHPQGGLFIWADLPAAINTRELLAEAIENHVAFVPGQAFHADGSGSNTMRLNFSNVTPDRIEEGVMRLGKAIATRLGAR
ncbi:MAG: PLP-dependent aminotransferase family protein [Dehalococcoidia bacterium]|nr:PLP-dependent aminotransferase family protein [Dehalococcoidia bacterium]MCB9486454.1 PLP-dependent aminotransferase family protein [Thermoflexaceae bacterium]